MPPSLPTFSLSLHPGQGVELGRFRLKPGVSEQEMRTAYEAMVQGTLTPLPGWAGQGLIALAEGEYIDLALAEDQPQAEAICASWQGKPACEAFLALIEPISLTFGTLLVSPLPSK